MNNNTDRHNVAKRKPPRQSVARLAGGAILTLAALLGTTTSAVAADEQLFYSSPAGEGCVFRLDIYGTAGKQNTKLFTDRNGQVIRSFSVGKGNVLRFVNFDSGSSLLIKPTVASVTRTTYNPDGTTTTTQSGNNTILLFPTDNPQGPITILYVGSVTFTTSATGVTTITSSSGKQVDICAALSS